MSIQAQLKKAKALWGKAKKMKSDYDSVVTDGIYVGRLVKAELGESQSSGRLQVAFKATILKGEFKGESISWWSGLKTEDNFMYLQKDLQRLGKEVPEDVSDLEGVLEELAKEKPQLRFKVQHSGEFTNVRIVKALDVDLEDAEEEEEEEDEDTEEEAEEEEDSEEEAEEEEEESEEEEEEEDDKDSKEEEEDDDAEEEAEDPEDEGDEAETPDLDVGMRVVFKNKGKETAGEVVKIDYKKEEAIVKTDEGPKYRVMIEKLKPAPKTSVKKAKKGKK